LLFKRFAWKDPRVTNRFAELVEHELAVSSPADLEVMSEMLVRCCDASESFASPPVNSNHVLQTIGELCSGLRRSVWAANNPEDAHIAIKAFNAAKKRLKKERARDAFISRALTAPREDKCFKGKCQPIECNGKLSFNPAEWETEFCTYYRSLFDAADNDRAVQKLRLETLSRTARAEARISVPLFLVREVLSSAGRRGGKACGVDRLGWGCLACLPFRAIETIRSLIEARINSTSLCVEDDVFRSWGNVLVHLIPKVVSAKSVKQWRPIAVCSVMQKLFLSVVVRLAAYFSRPALEEQAGFSAGRQTMEVSETCRLALQKCPSW
jgi:hypothetical protein